LQSVQLAVTALSLALLPPVLSHLERTARKAEIAAATAAAPSVLRHVAPDGSGCRRLFLRAWAGVGLQLLSCSCRLTSRRTCLFASTLAFWMSPCPCAALLFFRLLLRVVRAIKLRSEEFPNFLGCGLPLALMVRFQVRGVSSCVRLCQVLLLLLCCSSLPTVEFHL